MSILEEYIRLGFSSGEAFVRKDRLKDICKIDAVIFDCDGVLIDVRDSYDRAIAKTTAWIFETLTGCRFPEELISSEIIFHFRKSGGFNMDTDIVYGLLMFLLSELPGSFLQVLAKTIREVGCEGRVLKRVRAVGEKRGIDITINLNGFADRIKEFTLMLDDTGIISVDKAIMSTKRIPEKIYATIKGFLYESRRVGESIIATVFEEIFCGPSLFREIYGVEPEISFNPGTIENSRVIITTETLNRLSQLIGGAKFGIASGSRLASARYVLGGILEKFKSDAKVFLDDIERVEGEYSARGLTKVSLVKPNPYSLLKSAWALEPFRMALFVGDSMEDTLAARNANKLDPRFIFAGVYAYTGSRDAMDEFIKSGCDIISPSVNEIPHIIEAVRGMLEGGRVL